jgi:hypothetical protein
MGIEYLLDAMLEVARFITRDGDAISLSQAR